MKKNLKNIYGFSLIEVLVGIFIFSMGLVSVYAIIASTIKLNDYNRDYIIATALAGEQLELIRNYRDSNYAKLQKYDQINTNTLDYNNVFSLGSYYKIENDYSNSAPFPILLEELSDFGEGISEVNGKMQDYKICLDSNNLYTYDCSLSNTETKFFKYIYIDEVKYNDGTNNIVIDKAIKVTSKVIWVHRGYQEFETSVILTDYKRL